MLLDLPSEMLDQILGYVKTDSYAIIGTVCSAFHKFYPTPSEKITKISKFFQSPQLLEQAPLIIHFRRPHPLDDLIVRNEIDVIPLLLSRGLVEWDPFCVQRAAETNNTTFFRWLINSGEELGLPWLPENAHCAAAEAGNLDLMIYLVESGAGYPDDRALLAAKRGNYTKIVGWLCELSLDRVYEMVRAAREDNVHVFEQTEEYNDHHQNQKYVREACINGSFDVLEFFRVYVGVGPTARDVAAAVHFNHGEVAEWCGEFFPGLI